MYYLPQTAKQVQTDKKEETENYFKTAFEYFSEEIKNMHEIKNEEKINLCIEASGANEGLIVNDKPTFEECFTDDEFAVESVMVSDDSKAYIDNLFIKIDVIPTMEILPEPFVSPIQNFRQTSSVVTTLAKYFLINSKPNLRHYHGYARRRRSRN